jgi:hypothetical protein
MLVERRRGAPRVKFEPPIRARFMAIDGTWSRGCAMIDASETGSQIEFEGSVAGLNEFFLVLSETTTQPVYRRCKLVWVNGNRMGVEFQKGHTSKGS